MISVVELSKFAQDLGRAAKDTPKAYRRLLQRVGERHLELMDSFAPPDDEGRLRASLQRRTHGHGKEWVLKIKKDGVEAGSSVYYAPMVNDGHVMGKRIDNRGHRKTDPDKRRRAAKAAGRVWVNGTFFREQAEDAIELEMDGFAADFADEALSEVMR